MCAEISPLVLKSLGPGNICEIENCGRQAYMHCGVTNYYYNLLVLCCCGKLGRVKQCGRKCCEQHVSVWYIRQRRGYNYDVEYYCCKEQGNNECRNRFRKHFWGLLLLGSLILLSTIPLSYIDKKNKS